MSLAICFSMTFAVMIINAILGVFVGIGYYFAMAFVSTICLIIGLVMFDLKRIVTKKKKVVSKPKKASKQTKIRSAQQKRKIS